MEQHLQPPPTSKSGRGHVRVTSEDRRRISALRKASNGPLDELDDPLRSSTSPQSPELSQPTIIESRSKSPLQSIGIKSPGEDFAFLLQAQNFHPLIASDVNIDKLEQGTQSLKALLNAKKYFTAAVLAAEELTSLSPGSDREKIFELWYIRLACLCLIHQTGIAAQESKALGDLTNPLYKDVNTNSHIVPWNLRVLCVRLQALGFSEPRRGLMAYYQLAQDAREEATAAMVAERRSDMRLWKTRLYDLGLSVACALVEMDDCVAAAQHLKSLQSSLDGDLAYSQKLVLTECLTWIRIGNLSEATLCVRRLSQQSSDTDIDTLDQTQQDFEYNKRVLQALITTCEGEYTAATLEWEASLDSYPDDAVIQQNLAVCHLYTCNIAKSREALNTILNREPIYIFQSLLFNLGTLYELSAENSQALKTQLAEQVSKGEDGAERARIEFKL